jgi:hypothetical protein
MKRNSLALIFSFLAISFAAAQGRDDKKQHELVGQVKTVEVGRIEYTLVNGKNVAGKRVPNHTITFSEEGNKTEEISYDPKGSVSNKAVYAYDKQGKLKSYESSTGIREKNLINPQRNEYKLDDRGNVIEQVNYQSNGTLGSRFLYKYDAKGNKIEEIFYAWNGSRMGKLLNTYDEAGHILTQTSYNEDDSVSWKHAITYDAKGRKIEGVQYIAGVLRYRVTFRYDDKDRIVEQETFEYNKVPNQWTSHAPEPGKIIYTYNDQKRTQEIDTYSEDGSLKHKMVYQRDERGNEIGRRMFNGDGSPKNTELHWYDNGKLLRTMSGIETIKIEYDSKGNWIKKVRMIQSANATEPEAYAAEYRDITYY